MRKGTTKRPKSELRKSTVDDNLASPLPKSTTTNPPIAQSGSSSSSSTDSSDSREEEESTLKQQPIATKSMNKNEALAVEEEQGDSKKQPLLIKRLFSDNDEIALLQGLYDYTSNKDTDAFSDFDGFFYHVKDSLECSVSKAQINDKIRRLKKKYFNNSIRKGKKGDEPSFSKAHEQKSYELSKKIWGPDGEVPTQKRPARKLVLKSNGEDVSMEIDVNRVVKDLFQGDKELEECAIKCGIEAADETTKAELDKKSKKLLVAKLEYFVEKTKLKLKLAELVFEAAKAVDH